MEKIGFISAYGDAHLPSQEDTESPFFAIVAVVIEKSYLPIIESQVTKLQNALAKQRISLHNTHLPFHTRLTILKNIANMGFHIYAMVIDKRKISEESGLVYQDSFYKYFNRLLDSDLYRYYPILELVSQPFESDVFMESFMQYVKKHHLQIDIFRKPTFRFGNTQSDSLLQLSTFIASSIGKCYESPSETYNPYAVAEVLEKRILHIREYPDIPLKPYTQEPEEEDKKYDMEIANFSRSQAMRFIQNNQDATDTSTILQIRTLQYLLFKFKLNPYEYIYTDELISRINSDKEHISSKQIFRSEVIAGLRDSDVLVVSGANGYKIPASKADLYAFFNRYNQIIQPMMHRLERCNLLIKTATTNKVDVLENEAYHNLKEMIKVSSN